MGTSANSRLSVVLVVRDEQEVLADTLNSVKSIADQVIVVDTGSTDRTVPIATQFAAKVLTHPWSDDFSAARNRGLDEATGDWILWLNAGERLDAEAAAKLPDFLSRHAHPGKVYALMVEMPPAAVGASPEQTAQLRLLPRAAGLRFEGRVRETLQPSVDAAGLTVDLALGRVLCHQRSNDPQRKLQQARRNLRILTAEKEIAGVSQLRLLLATGETLSDLGERDTARRAFRQAIGLAETGSIEMLEGYYGLLASYEGDQQQRQPQLAVCLEALEKFPLDSQLLCALGNCLQLENRLDLAARAFETAVKHGQSDPRTWHLVEIPEIAAVCLSLIRQLQKKDDEAMTVLREALARCESSARVRHHLIDLCIQRGRTDEALQVAAGLPLPSETLQPLADAIRGACAAVRREWTPALASLQAAYLAGCQSPLCLRWLSVVLLAKGQSQAAEPILRKWLQVEPDNQEILKYLEAAQAGPSQDAPAPDSAKARQLRIDQGEARPGSPLPAPLTTPPVSAPTDIRPPAMP